MLSEKMVKSLNRQMYGAVLAHFPEQGMRFAEVRTGLDEAHAPARRAYERTGFNIRHEDVTYFKKLCLRKYLLHLI